MAVFSVQKPPHPTARPGFIFPLLLVLSFLLAACSGSAAPSATEAPSPSTQPAVATFPLTVSDALGHQITLDKAPQRIISLSPSNTEILFAVGAWDQVVADTKYCNYPAAAKLLPKIGGFTADTISVETIISMKPDLVLANSTDQEATVKALEDAQVKVVALAAASFDDVFANITLVGKLSGHLAEANRVVEQMKNRLAAVNGKIGAVPQEKRPNVFWEVWDDPLMTVGPATFIGQMIDKAGGVNLFADLSQDYPQVSVEEVIKRNPAVIMGPDSHGDKLTSEQLASRPGWSAINAVGNKRIYLIDGDSASRPGPRLVDALKAIAKALYPDLFH